MPVTPTPHPHGSRKDSGLTGSSTPPLNLSQSNSPAVDHVFPMSSAVSLDPTSTPSNRPEGGDVFLCLTPLGNSRSVLRQQTTSSAGKSSDYVETTSKNRYDADKHASGSRNASSVTSGSLRRAPSCIGRTEIKRTGGSLPPMHRSTGSPSEKSEISNDDASEKSESGASAQNRNVSTIGSLRNIAADAESLMTTRFKHVMIEGGHAVIVGRNGDTFQRCEDEPIHIPGAVQSFGVLIALQEDDENRLKVRVVSENSERIRVYTPNQLFQLSNFCDMLSEEQSYDLFEYIDFIQDDDSDPAINGREVFLYFDHSLSLKKTKETMVCHSQERHKQGPNHLRIGIRRRSCKPPSATEL